LLLYNAKFRAVMFAAADQSIALSSASSEREYIDFIIAKKQII